MQSGLLGKISLWFTDFSPYIKCSFSCVWMPFLIHSHKSSSSHMNAIPDTFICPHVRCLRKSCPFQDAHEDATILMANLVFIYYLQGDSPLRDSHTIILTTLGRVALQLSRPTLGYPLQYISMMILFTERPPRPPKYVWRHSYRHNITITPHRRHYSSEHRWMADINPMVLRCHLEPRNTP